MNKTACKDWLIVSDVDGTLNNNFRKTVKSNLKAVADFTDRGGNFTIASGRNLQSARRIFDKLNVKTPFIFMNGAGIYDSVSENLLFYNSISDIGQKKIYEAAEKFPSAEIAVFTVDKVYFVRPRFFGYSFIFAEHLNHEVCDSIKDVPSELWGKVSFFDIPERLKRIRLYINEDTQSEIRAVPTSSVSLELMNENVNKGVAVKKLAEILGIEMKNTCAIGDYYNDLEMLGVVGFPACCGQAPQEIKAISKYCACHTNKGAVADLIYYLMKNHID